MTGLGLGILIGLVGTAYIIYKIIEDNNRAD
jgi:hypothetical protein